MQRKRNTNFCLKSRQVTSQSHLHFCHRRVFQFKNVTWRMVHLPMFMTRICGGKPKQLLLPVASLQDQKSHAEAFVVSFLAEHTLPFTMAPQVIRLAQELERDHKTLQSLSMDRTITSYKLREGLGETIHGKILRNLQQVFFSMNVDECMSNAFEKIFSISVLLF